MLAHCPPPQKTAKFGQWLGLLALNWGIWGGAIVPAQAAETIMFNFGPLEFSIAVDSLEQYASTGEIAPDFRDVTARLSAAQLTELRAILLSRADVDPVALTQFLYSPQGEIVLRQLGDLILTRKRQSGFYALRAALILAAADQETGLTPINVLRQFPVDGVRINSTLALDLINDVSRKIQQTEAAIATIETAAAQTAARQPAESFPLEPRQPGLLPFDKQTLILNDPERLRLFPADLYLPKRPPGQKLPLVIISHGLGSDRQTFAYLAQHLASHGFAVAVPEHPGSNAAQLKALAAGLERDLTPPQELIDRPLDIQFLLDQLAQRYGSQVNTERVGIIGQSFGGYTALALAGAGLNWPALAEHCPQARYSLNWSLVLQCAALKLSAPVPRLRDPRIVSAIAINPLTSIIFGAEQLAQIQVPVMLIASGADTVTPALEEQITAFGQLRAPQSHLALLSKGTHFSTLGSSAQDVALPAAVLGPDPTIAQDYVRALSLAFFAVNVAARSDYGIFLSSAYAQHISMPVNPLAVITPTPPPSR